MWFETEIFSNCIRLLRSPGTGKWLLFLTGTLGKMKLAPLSSKLEFLLAMSLYTNHLKRCVKWPVFVRNECMYYSSRDLWRFAWTKVFDKITAFDFCHFDLDEIWYQPWRETLCSFILKWLGCSNEETRYALPSFIVDRKETKEKSCFLFSLVFAGSRKGLFWRNPPLRPDWRAIETG